MSGDSKQKQAADRAVEVLDGHVLFSRRCRIAEAAVRWCNDHAATPSPFNIVTALSALGMLRCGDASSRLRLTDAECEDLRTWQLECKRQGETATEGGNEELAQRWMDRRKRAFAMLKRHVQGGET